MIAGLGLAMLILVFLSLLYLFMHPSQFMGDEAAPSTESLKSTIDGFINSDKSPRYLLALADNKSPEVRIHALNQLFRLMPPRQEGEMDFATDISKRLQEARYFWIEELKPEIQRTLARSLRSDALQEVAAAAHCVALLADKSLLWVLTQAADRIAPDTKLPEANLQVLHTLARAASAIGPPDGAPLTVNQHSSPGRLVLWANTIASEPGNGAEAGAADLLLHMMRLAFPPAQVSALSCIPDGFSRCLEIPWKTLLTSEDLRVWQKTIRVATRLRTPSLSAIIPQVLAKTKDPGKTRELNALLEVL